MARRKLPWLLRYSRRARKAYTQRYMERAGRPPPLSPAGDRYDQQVARQQALLNNPPPIHGDARWLTEQTLGNYLDRLESSLKANDRYGELFDLGDLCPPPNWRTDDPKPLITGTEGHLLTVAGTRAGKGACHIMPALFTWPGSVLVIDPKGENYAITAEHRRRNGPVYRLDPFGVSEAWDKDNLFDTYNPFDFVEDDDDARLLAEMLLGAPPEKDPFWYLSAQSLLTGLVGYFAWETKRGSIADVRAILRQSMGDLFDWIVLNLTQNRRSTLISAAGYGYTQLEDKVRSSVLGELNARLGVWDTKAMQVATATSSFDFADMKHEPFTVYAILPFDKIDTYGAYLRMLIEQFRSAMMRSPGRGPVPVLCIADEFPSIGRMDAVIRALGEIAGYGVRFWLFAQSISQLQTLYGDAWHTINAQCSTKSYFGIDDERTAEHLSKTLGRTTIAYLSSTETSGVSIPMGEESVISPTSGFSSTPQFAGQDLITAQQIRRAFARGRSLQLVWLGDGLDPAVGTLIPWFTDPEMKPLGRDIHNVQPTSRPAARGRRRAQEVQEPGIPSPFIEIDDDDDGEWGIFDREGH